MKLVRIMVTDKWKKNSNQLESWSNSKENNLQLNNKVLKLLNSNQIEKNIITS